MEGTPTVLSELSGQGLDEATSALVAGDEVAARLAQQTNRLIAAVNRSSLEAFARSRALHSDDLMNPNGRARKLAELPAELKASTEDALRQAQESLVNTELYHKGRILRHDPKNDSGLRWELDNYLAGVKPDERVATLTGLARNPRYSTFLASDAGHSVAVRVGLRDRRLPDNTEVKANDDFRREALESLIASGSEDQVRRGQALSSIARVKAKLDQAREGRDNVLSEIPRPPKPAPSQAMF